MEVFFLEGWKLAMHFCGLLMCLVHLYSFLANPVGFKSWKSAYMLYCYHVENRFGDIIINREKSRRNGKPGRHWERAVKIGSLRKIGRVGKYVLNPVWYIKFKQICMVIPKTNTHKGLPFILLLVNKNRYLNKCNEQPWISSLALTEVI